MELWAEIRRLVLTKRKSKRAICQDYNLHWKTLQKILNHAEPPGYRQRQPRAKPKLDRFLPIIHDLLEQDKQSPPKQRHTIKRIPNHKTLDNFKFESQPSLNRLLVAELMRCQYIEQRESVILIGNPGTGKTHVATALAIEACHRGYQVRFYRVTELVTQLMEAREERQLLRMKAQLAKLDLLVLDELGYVPASKLGAELLFDVISTAYERTSLIVTTNLPFENWTEVLGSERLT